MKTLKVTLHAHKVEDKNSCIAYLKDKSGVEVLSCDTVARDVYLITVITSLGILKLGETVKAGGFIAYVYDPDEYHDNEKVPQLQK